jgi:hypothetical protein
MNPMDRDWVQIIQYENVKGSPAPAVAVRA